MTDLWKRYLRRAGELERLWPDAALLIRFFRSVVNAQEWFYGLIVAEKWDDMRPRIVLPRIPEFIARIKETAPDMCHEDLDGWSGLDWSGDLQTVLLMEWSVGLKGPIKAGAESHESVFFFMRLLLQPYGIWRYAAAKRCGDPDHDPSLCPVCERSPIASVVRQDLNSRKVRRNLLCSFCPTEWSLARPLCPACKEESPDHLRRLSSPEIPWIQVDACDTCGKYLKSVDLSVEPGAEPVVDEMASIPLDQIAQEENYTRFVPNLAGG